MSTKGMACLALLALLAPARAQSDNAKTIAYLKDLQTKDGGFLAAKGQDKPTLRATSGAVRALKYFGGEPKDRDAAAKFVASCHDAATGGFTDQPGQGKPDVILTAVGLMAVMELKLPAEKYTRAGVDFLVNNAKSPEEVRMAAAGLEAVKQRPAKADDWLKGLTQRRNKDGTYGKGKGLPRETGGSVAMELRLGAKPENAAEVLKALRAGQREDGGFGKEDSDKSDLETTYRVMRAFHMLNELPDAKKVREFVARCRNDDGGYGVAPGQASTVSGTYFAGIVLHWLERK